jgi:hypothetical protein
MSTVSINPLKLNISYALSLYSYPVRYIYRQLHKFFVKITIQSTSILPMIHDKNEYHLLRRRILEQPTQSEHARAERIATQLDYNNINVITDPLVISKLLKRQPKSNSLIIHYTYEQRFAYYKSLIHKYWGKSLQNILVIDNLLIIGTRNNPNLTQELVRRSPYTPKVTETVQKIDHNTKH